MDIVIPKNFFGEEIEVTVFISEEQLHETSCKPLYGKYFAATGIFNIFPEELDSHGEYLGEVLPAGQQPPTDGFCGVAAEEGITFFLNGKKLKTEAYGLYQSIFSRNKGILETDAMNRK